MLEQIMARLREPSTHAAIATLLGVGGVSVNETLIGQIMIGIAGVFAVVGMFKGEAKGGKLVEPKE